MDVDMISLPFWRERCLNSELGRFWEKVMLPMLLVGIDRMVEGVEGWGLEEDGRRFDSKS